MQNETPLDAVDSRVVFRAYALIVGAIGLVVTVRGEAFVGGPLNGQPWGINSITRMVGVAIVAAAVCAWAASRLADPGERRRVLGAFVIAHGVVLAMAWIQTSAVWGDALPRPVHLLFFALAMTTMGLTAGFIRHRGDLPPFATWLNSLREPPPTRPAPRSHYEASIREAAAQEERNRLARDLHDSIKQQIFAIQTSAATAEARLGGDADGTRVALAQVREAARDAMAEMDVMLDQMRAAPIENAGLVEAIRKQCEALELRTGATTRLAIGLLPPSQLLPPGTHQVLLRIAQEALSNVARHARASEVSVALERVSDALVLTIADNGSGLPSDAAVRGMGLRNIRDRTAEVGGTADIASPNAGGTTVSVSVPLAVADLRTYRHRACWAIAALVILAGIVTAEMQSGRGSELYLILLVPVLIDAARYIVAWRRARRLMAGLA